MIETGGYKDILLMPEYEEIHTLVRMFERRTRYLVRELRKGPYSVSHGDVKSDNFFFREDTDTDDERSLTLADQDEEEDEEEDEEGAGRKPGAGGQRRASSFAKLGLQEKFSTEDCVLCDFQLSNVCNPTRDIACFAVLNIDVAERRAWLLQVRERSERQKARAP
jgi:hypothetical protein